ncbi:MAG: hypothetical protein EBS19_00880 [Spirochaetia bacterium]|nr:hypothetical protein [Spirochaetia bacterium]
MNKNISILLFPFLTALISSCGSLPRIDAPGLDGSSAKPYEIPGCQLQLTVPAGWKGELEGTTLHIIKDKIDIIVDVTTEKDLPAIQTKVVDKMKELLKRDDLKSNPARTRKSAGGVDIQILPAWAGQDSVDVDAVLCPSGRGAVLFYSLSPLSSYKTDRPQVIAFVDSAKSLGSIEPAKK